MDDCDSIQRILAKAQEALTLLGIQAAIYTSSTIPIPLKMQLDEKREEVKSLKEQLQEAQLAKQEAPKADQIGIDGQSLMRSQVPDRYYIERDKAKKLLEKFAIALQQPQEKPLLFNISGIGGVGKTTLLKQLKDAHVGEVDFLEVCFAKTPGIETPLKLMRNLHQKAIALLNVETSTNSFTQREQQFQKTLFELSEKSLNGEATSNEEARKIRGWFERLIWFALTDVTSTSNKSKSFEASGLQFSTSAAIGEDAEGLQEWIQQRVRNHPATEDKPELQALMLYPVAQLTQAFAESLIQIAQSRGRSLVLVVDTYEKAQSYLNQWLWQYLVEDTPLPDAPVRLVVVGRRSLQADEGWRKLNQDRKLLHEIQLEKFSKPETWEYLKQIGIENDGTRSKIYKATQGLPYYLDWVRRQKEQGEELDFSQGNQAIAELLLQGLNSPQRKILQVVACCRWFDLAMIRYLLGNNDLGLPKNIDQAENYFEWLKSSDFVEFTEKHYRLDDVARDVFRQSYFQEDRNQFRKTHALLADYFKQQTNEIVAHQSFLPDIYEDEDWQRLIFEFLYYSLFGKGKEGLRQYIEQVFISIYLGEPDVFIAPFSFINAELNEENQHLLPTETNKFFKESEIALDIGWFFLDETPKSYKIKLEGENPLSEEAVEAFTKKIETSIQSLLGYVGDLKDGLGKYVGLIFKSLRCNTIRERIDLILRAKSQTEQLLTDCSPKLVYHLLVQLGNLLSSIDRYEAALGSFQKAVDLDPESVKAWVNQGAALNKLERYEEALESCQKAVNLDPESAIAWVNQGVALGNLEQYEEALESCQKAVDLQPESAIAWRFRGFALEKLERYEEALESFQKAVDLDPESIKSWVSQGALLDELERYEEALKSFQKAVDLDPKSIEAWVNRGDTLRKLERYEEAVTALDKALKIETKDVDILNAQALALSLLKDFEKAIIVIDKAIKLEPQEVLLKSNRGIILARAGRYTEAFTDCEQAIKQDPQDVSGYYAKACYYALQNEIEQAIDNLQKAIDIEPRRCRREAKNNPDFDSLRDDNRFQALNISIRG